VTLREFVGFATTCDVEPGHEDVRDGHVQVRGRRFRDHVESDDAHVAGVNEPVLDIDINAETGQGTVHGRFSLTPESGDGTWEGELQGGVDGGMVRASGLATGTGARRGQTLYVEFRQVPDHPVSAPCESPQAYFEMRGLIKDS
jgi:hypothetical protein